MISSGPETQGWICWNNSTLLEVEANINFISKDWNKCKRSGFCFYFWVSVTSSKICKRRRRNMTTVQIELEFVTQVKKICSLNFGYTCTRWYHSNSDLKYFSNYMFNIFSTATNLLRVIEKSEQGKACVFWTNLNILPLCCRKGQKTALF